MLSKCSATGHLHGVPFKIKYVVTPCGHILGDVLDAGETLTGNRKTFNAHALKSLVQVRGRVEKIMNLQDEVSKVFPTTFPLSTRIYSHLLASTCIYSHLLASTRIYSHLLASTCIYSHLLAFTRIYSHLLSSTRIYSHLLAKITIYFTGKSNRPRSLQMQLWESRTNPICVQHDSDEENISRMLPGKGIRK